MVRFGATMVGRNVSSKQEHQRHIQRLATEAPSLEARLNTLVSEIVARVHQHDPLVLLRTAYGHFAAATIGVKSESEMSAEQGMLAHVIEYVQSVIAGTDARPRGAAQPLTEDVFDDLRAKVFDLYSSCALYLQIVRTAARQLANEPIDPQEELRTQCEMWWTGVRKVRYDYHDLPYLRQFLAPHTCVIRDLYGISADEFVTEIGKLRHALSRGLGEAAKTLIGTCDRFLKAGGRTTPTKEELQEVLSNLRSEPAVLDAVDRLFGDGNFDVQRNSSLPITLLDELSWRPAEETESFRSGDERGWPLRLLPWRQRPFLKINDRYYCHNISALLDRLYRQIERLVCTARPQCRDGWRQRQADALEETALELFLRLLPGATILPRVRYQWPATTSPRRNWNECDGLILFDDHLIVVEARSGSFTYTTPETDFVAHINSLMSLVQKPWDQTRRFLEYLGSAPEVPIYRELEPGRYEETLSVRQDGFREITACGVTLDNLGHLAARAEKLQALGVGTMTGHTLWSVAVDDLMVCADLFDSPTTFCHYLEQRRAARENERFQLQDETDHLGMYFSRNLYSSLTQDAPPKAKLMWTGFGAVIDAYFANLMYDAASAKRPTQDLPPLLDAVIRALDHSGAPARCRAASIILNLGGEGRTTIAGELEQFISVWLTERRIRAFSLPGLLPLTVVVSSVGSRLDAAITRKQVALAMLAIGQSERTGLELVVDEAGAIRECHPFVVRRDELRDELPVLEEEARKVAARRIENEIRCRVRKKIGRNEECPCGSGRKWKKCHGQTLA